MTSKHTSSSKLLSINLFDNLKSFDEIEARISALPSNKERGDAFEIFAEAYLATQKIAQAKEVWPFEAVPLEQRQLLSLDTGRDMGVDGTYVTIDGELRAYQVKFRSNRTALNWDELSTFMGLTDQVSQRVLFTNSETLPSLMQDRTGFVAIRGSDLDRLTSDDFDTMREWMHSGKVTLTRKQPMPHQQEALTAISKGLETNDRATVVMACGTGKSLVALWASEQQSCKTILVLVPSLALVRQLLHEWLRETAWEQFTFMCVCSDPSVTRGADDLMVNQADLDFPVTTDSATVAKFLSKPFDGVKLVFSTYQSAQVVAAGLPLDVHGIAQPFDLAIFDEAHKTASRDGTRFSFALEDANLPIRKRLFFTATPRHYDIRKKDKEGDNTLVYSMDKPEIYGHVVYTLSFAEAARRGIICDYKVVISVVTSDMVNDHALKHGEVIVDGDTVKARQVALQIALQKAVEKYGVSRIFTFHSSVAAARSFTSNDGEGIKSHLPDFTTLHVSGEMRTSLREDHMKAFRQADKAVMSNARCLTEGVDVPAVDMVAFISPRKSKVDIVQATGRAMRKSDATGKQFGYVMVPLFVEQAANESIEDALKRTGFDDVWDLLGAMREQDDVLNDIIREMRQEKGRTGGYDESRFSEHIEVVGPSVSLDTIKLSITTECLESLSSSWDERFGELLAFTAREGHCLVPKNYKTTDGANLGIWASNQRANQNSMLNERREQLEALTGWVWNIIDEQWEIGFRHLKEYSDREGHCQVSVGYRTADGYRLGQWMALQRTTKDSFLSAERKERLESVVGWVWDRRDAQWEASFDELKMYKAEHGDVDVPINWFSGLGSWASVQRRAEKNGKLSPERKAKLDEVGFEWDKLDSLWDKRYQELLAYLAEHGNAEIVQKDPTGLGAWLSQQKLYFNSGKLPASRLEKLNSISNLFENRKPKTDWDERFNELVAYKAGHGNLDVPRNWPTGLGIWLGNQKSFIKNNKLPLDRKDKLYELGLIWESLDSRWESRLDELREYSAKFGDVNVPYNWSTGLGKWIANQKSFVKAGRMSESRKKILKEIGLIWSIDGNSDMLTN
jgi:superfamily II DNA or RNA helicase